MTIRNTSDDPYPEWCLGGNPNAIYAQEAQGQSELVNSAQLPTEGSENPAWEKMGVIFGDKTPGDPIFRAVVLPSGWKKKADDHSMWSTLVDDKGRERAAIFYKAAFYDRRARITPNSRFGILQDRDIKYSATDKKIRTRLQVIDSATGAKLYATALEEHDQENYWNGPGAASLDRHQAECEEWLSKRFPNWRDASAHWDDEIGAATP